MSLPAIEMQMVSYITFACFLASFSLMLFLFIKSKQISTYGFLYVMFFFLLMGITILNSQDIKNCIYTAICIWLNLLIFSYYQKKMKLIVCFFCIALSLCVYANFLHLITHPSLWLIQTEKEGTGYLLGDNYNQMGCRMIIALACSVICNRFSKLWRINFFALAIICIVSLSFVGSMTSLSMIVLYLLFCLIPSQRLRNIGITCLFVTFILFHIFVVFAGRGLENNEFAVYFVEDILHKDITFTHRTYMWESALKVIAQSPFWGYGYINSDWFIKNMSSFAIGPHNFILSILIEGGMLLFSIYIFICVRSYAAIRHFMNQKIAQEIVFATICLWFMSLMEMYPYPIMMFPLILSKYYRNLES